MKCECSDFRLLCFFPLQLTIWYNRRQWLIHICNLKHELTEVCFSSSSHKPRRSGTEKISKYKLSATSSAQWEGFPVQWCLLASSSHRALLEGRCTLYCLELADCQKGWHLAFLTALRLRRSPEEALKTNPILGTMQRIYGKDKTGEIYMKYPSLRYGAGTHKPGRTTLSHKILLFSISTELGTRKKPPKLIQRR